MPYVEVGQPLPSNEEFDQEVKNAKFWRLSYRGGRKLIEGNDGSGNEVVCPHPKEIPEAYKSRLKIATAFNYTKPIINRYNDLVFSKMPVREVEGIEDFYENVTGFGSDIDSFMKDLLKSAQIENRSFILLDTVSENGGDTIFGQISKLQAEAIGLRTVFRKIKLADVPYIKVMDNQVVHAIVMLEDEKGVFAWEVGSFSQRRIDVDKNLMVTDIGEWENHNYGGCPLVMLRPYEEDSQASDIAEIQKAIINLNSLLLEELFGSTFTQWALLGGSVTDVEGLAKGVNRLLAINKAGVSLQTLSSDPSQAASIRDTIKEFVHEIYRTAGITTGNALESGPEISGIALAFLSQGMVTQARALAKSAADTEKLAIRRFMNNEGINQEVNIVYNTDFSVDETSNLDNVIRVVESAMPQTIKEAMIKAFASTQLDLSDEQMDKLADEMLSDLDLGLETQEETIETEEVEDQEGE